LCAVDFPSERATFALLILCPCFLDMADMLIRIVAVETAAFVDTEKPKSKACTIKLEALRL